VTVHEKTYFPEYAGKLLMSRKKFFFRQVTTWIVLLTFLCLLVCCGYYWKEIAWYWKVFLFLLLLFTPDRKNLFESYGKYKEHWEQANEPKET